MSDNTPYTWMVPTAFGGLIGLLFGAALTAAGGRPVVLPYTVAGVVAGLASTLYLRWRSS